MKKIVIVGAGASGVYLSILLKQKLNHLVDVIVLEQNATSLKKVLATGNGRCNLSNKDMSIDYYQSDNNQIVETIISHFDMKEKLSELGLYCIYQGNLLYPKSEQALSVKNILMDQAKQLGVTFFYEEEVQYLEYKRSYLLKTQKQNYNADYIIFAMGSEAGKLSGTQPSRYQILKDMGLKVCPSLPSLVQMRTQPALKQLKGVRVKGTFTLYENDIHIHQEKGELLFTDYGVSGIAVMQLSSFYKENHKYELAIDFFDDQDTDNLKDYIELRMNKGYNHFYDGLLNSKISSYFETFHYKKSDEITSLLKDFRLKIIGLQSYENAQVMKGGLSLKEVDSDLQIKAYQNIYAIGEILNVVGMCGGYNLHFAFSSAEHVANAIERKLNDKNS
ncbi:MAG: aminoacetone oxidase family FAD-binding enzyme [Coprobacillus sp.]